MGSSYVSDTESVESDEVDKLQTEAADLADMEIKEVCKYFVAMSNPNRDDIALFPLQKRRNVAIINVPVQTPKGFQHLP